MRERIEELSVPVPRSMVIACHIADRDEQPRQHASVDDANRRPFPPQFEEGDSGRVFGILVLLQQSTRGCDHPATVEFEHEPERFTVPADTSRPQLQFVGVLRLHT